MRKTTATSLLIRTVVSELQPNAIRITKKRGIPLPNKLSHSSYLFSYFLHPILFLDEEWKDGSKANAAQAYKTFCEAIGIQIPKDINFDKWSKRQQKLPWIPLEIEIDQLIAGYSRKIAAFLQLLKETWCRSGEAWRLEWTDVDSERNIITINSPEKNRLPRQFRVSSKLIAMLNVLPKTSHNFRIRGSTV